ncbi:membrane protein of ER body-like protein [Helianthus annuus]|uniref:membrane protein of ER body-like protein n=1 Tax=Helianthus annuus TaxID=4232 RepID=UPI000B902F1A|nr:membrane protein of ER body-like protein [Helianthus annuus]
MERWRPKVAISKNDQPPEHNGLSMDIAPFQNIESVAQPRGRPWLGSDGILLEILKSIVYGGSMAVNASLSVVAFAAASDATTLSIICLALASLVGGFFVIRHNLWELIDDCYKDNSSQESNNEATSKYKELLGEVNYFPLHVFFSQYYPSSCSGWSHQLHTGTHY